MNQIGRKLIIQSQSKIEHLFSSLFFFYSDITEEQIEDLVKELKQTDKELKAKLAEYRPNEAKELKAKKEKGKLL